MKYLYPYECQKMHLSTPAELQAAIDGNRREGRRSSYGTYAEMVQRAPSGGGGGGLGGGGLGGGGGLVGSGLSGGLPGGVQMPTHPSHPAHPAHPAHPSQMSPLSLVTQGGRLMNGNGHYNHNHQLLPPPGSGECSTDARVVTRKGPGTLPGRLPGRHVWRKNCMNMKPFERVDPADNASLYQ